MSSARPKIVVTHRIHADVAEELQQLGDVVLNETNKTLPRAEVLRRCRDADAMIVFMPDMIDEAFLAECPRLRIVSAALKGFDNFDVEACSRRGVWFTIVPDLLSEPTAELAVALLLSVTRFVRVGDREIREGRFTGWQPRWYGRSLTAGTAGLIGFGQVGRALAAKLTALGAKVCYFDKRRLSANDETASSLNHRPLEELLATSDFIFPLLPLTSATHHLLDARALAAMQPRSYLVNCGRGTLVDENAVAGALRSGQLAGYAADVFEMEDWARADRPRVIAPELLATDLNTTFTPHLGSAVMEVRRQIEREAVRRIAEWAVGERPRHAINSVLQPASA